MNSTCRLDGYALLAEREVGQSCADLSMVSIVPVFVGFGWVAKFLIRSPRAPTG